MFINNVGKDNSQPCDYSHEWDGEISNNPHTPKLPPPSTFSPFLHPIHKSQVFFSLKELLLHLK